MEFKVDNRVHVTKLDWDDVDFYATLKEHETRGMVFLLSDCTNSEYEGEFVWKPEKREFGDEDYYTLATDEEDSEEPVIQRVDNMYNEARSKNYEIQEYIQHDPVNKPTHYMLGDIEVKDIIAIVADKYHKGSVAHYVASALEYQMRAPEKNGLEDIKKARKCLDFAIENWE
ncbi:DUF3310 domain-containing protein [Mammaliicoccus sciuri]|uniref:DUF3310 domain-containing protein n=1 Tax=Mammaliicoccus sciuri TaxID=1296 RepID=UPI00195A8E7B|nr:DUF3310 domain-containing protein [Mammaliicoccus sciuri]